MTVGLLLKVPSSFPVGILRNHPQALPRTPNPLDRPLCDIRPPQRLRPVWSNGVSAVSWDARILDVTGLGHPRSTADPCSKAGPRGLFSSPPCWRGSFRASGLPSTVLTLALPGEGAWNSVPQIPVAAPGSPCTFY